MNTFLILYITVARWRTTPSVSFLSHSFWTISNWFVVYTFTIVIILDKISTCHVLLLFGNTAQENTTNQTKHQMM